MSVFARASLAMESQIIPKTLHRAHSLLVSSLASRVQFFLFVAFCHLRHGSRLCLPIFARGKLFYAERDLPRNIIILSSAWGGCFFARIKLKKISAIRRARYKRNKFPKLGSAHFMVSGVLARDLIVQLMIKSLAVILSHLQEISLFHDKRVLFLKWKLPSLTHV